MVITLTGVNDPPVAAADNVATNENTAINIAVLTGDSDVDSTIFNLTGIDSTQTLGNVTRNGNTVDYSPAGAFDDLVDGETAVDTFEYTITDDHGATSTALVTITISGLGAGLAAFDDNETVAEDATVDIDVLNNDAAGDPPAVLAVSSFNTTGTIGTVSHNTIDDSFTYDPNGQFESLAVGETATDSFTYVAEDGLGDTDQATVSITITGVNDVPVAVDDTPTTDEDSAIDVSVLNNDTDADASDTLSVTGIDTTGLLGTATLATNVVSYDPNGAFNSLAVGTTATETLTYTIDDGNGGGATGTMTITIEGRNEPPVALPDQTSTDEATAVSFNVLGNDSDTDSASISLTGVDGSQVAGNVTFVATGTITFDPAGQYEHLPVGEATTIEIPYTITDSDGATASSTLTVTIDGLNDDPQADDDNYSVVGNQTLSIPAPGVLANDNDVDVPAISGGSFFASPTGSPTGDGSFNQPWDLETLFAHPATLQPGDTVYLRGGTYVGAPDTFIEGTETSPITVRAYPGEHVTIDVYAPATYGDDRHIRFYGAYVHWVGIEFMSSDPSSRITDIPGSGFPDINRGGLTVWADHNKFINIISHDLNVGMGFWSDGAGGVIYGSIFFNNGWVGPDRPHGHGIYTQNELDVKQIVDSVVFNQFAMGIHAFGSSAAFIKGFDIEGNILFNNGGGNGQGYRAERDLLVGGATPAEDVRVANNFTYQTQHDGVWAFGLPNNSDNLDVEVEDNYVVGRIGFLSDWQDITFTGNKLYHATDELVDVGLPPGVQATDYTWDQNTYHSTATQPFRFQGTNNNFAGWQAATGFDANSTPIAAGPSGLDVFVRPNDYEAGRGHIVVYNWDLDPTVDVDLSSILQPGDDYEIRSLVDPLGTAIQSGTFDGTPVTITMAEAVPPSPIGYNAAAPVGIGPEFGAFLVTTPSNAVGALGLAVTSFDPLSSLGVPININELGGFDYDPTGLAIVQTLGPNDQIEDTFTYTVSDAHGGSSTATVTVTISGINHPPTAVDDDRATDEENSIIIDVLDNDDEPDQGDSLRVQSVDVAGTVGNLTINGDNTITYDPTGVLNHLSGGETFVDSFSYTIVDDFGGTDTALVNVTVTGVNDPPTANDDSGATSEDSAITLDVVDNDSDPDDDTLTVQSIDDSGLAGSASINVDGTITYDPNGQFDALAVGQSATEIFTYTISDGNGGSSAATATVTVQGANDHPSAVDDSATTDEETSISISVLQGDSDPDAGDTISLVSVDGSASIGAVSLGAGNTVVYDPSGSFDSLADGTTTTDTFTYTIQDSNGATATATVAIAITGIDDPPTAHDDNASTDEATAIAVDVLANDADPDSPAAILGLQRVADGLDSPVYVTSAPGDDDLLFIAEQDGVIKILDLQTGIVNPTPFLTITDHSFTEGSVRGLLGLAFHPNYATNRLFYVYMTDGNLDSLIRQYQANPDGLTADTNSATTILPVPQVDNYHYGGWIGFGPGDGYLYLASGDGGPGNDTDNDAQTIENNLRGKILRIDVDGDDFPSDPDRNYAIPTGNPFAGPGDPGSDEIFAYGLRNPWRSSFDRLTGDLYIGDVGQNAREEIDVIPAGTNGQNFGWRAHEGTISNPGMPDPDIPGRTDPIYDYLQGTGPSEGFSVTGGYVYRGPIQALQGHYFFGDFVTERIWSLKFNGDAPAQHDGTNFTGFTDWTNGATADIGQVNLIASFGEDNAGNLYIVDYSGEVFRVDSGSLPGDLSVQSVDGSTTAGTVTLINGVVTYDPAGQFESLAVNATDTDTFGYTIVDPFGATSTATVTVTIQGVNDPPNAVADSASTDERTAITIDVLNGDSDPDNGDTLSVTGVDGSGTQGIVTLQPDGTVSYDPDGQFNQLSGGQTATDTFSYQISDGNGGTATADVTVTINGIDAPPAPVDGLIAYWPLDDAAGTIASDQSGGGHDGALHGNPSWSAGNIDGGLDFDATGDYVNAGLGPSIVGTGGFTLAAWVRSSASGNQVIIQQRSPQQYNGEYQFHLTPAGKVRLWTFGNGYGPSVVSSQSINDGQWHHVVGVREDDGTTKVYVDGELDGRKAGAPRPLVPITVYLGADLRGFQNYLNGSLDEVRIYDRALDAQEVEDLYLYLPFVDPGLAVDDAYDVDQSASLSVADPGVLGNDIGSGLSVTELDTASSLGAVITDSGNGGFGYTPTTSTDYLAENETLTDTFEYTVSDGGTSDVGTVTITIHGLNDDPVANDESISTNEDAVISIAVLANDNDVDATDVLTVSNLDTTSTAGAAGINPNSTILYDPQAAFQSLPAGATATDSFVYTVSDGHGGTDTATVSITIAGFNDIPSAVDDATTTDEETPVDLLVLANDSDIDTGDVLTLDGVDTTGTEGDVTINGDTITYDPNGQFDDLVEGETGTDTFSYTVRDLAGSTKTALVTISITGIGVELRAIDDTETTSESASVVVDVLDNDLDGGSPSLTISSVDTTGTLGSVTIDQINDTVIYDPNGQFESLSVGQIATDSFGYTIDDGAGGSDSAVVNITISGENDQPTANPDDATTDEDSSVIVNVLGDDTDPDAADSLLIDSVDTNGTTGNVTVNPDGTLTYDPAGQFESLEAGQTAADSFIYTVTDSQGGFSTAQVSITINGADEATIPTDGLVAHWTLNDGSGTTAVDDSGNGHDGTLGGDPIWSGGTSGGGLDFDGSGDHINAGIGPSIVGTGGFSVAAWVRTSATTDQVIVQQRSPQQYNGEYQLHVLASGNVRFWTFGGFSYGAIVVSGQKINDGTWHHVVGVREDDGTAKVYIDGVLDGTRNGSPRPLIPIKVYIGADMRGQTKFLNGSLDEVLIYNRSLNDTEIGDLAAIGGSGDGLLLIDRPASQIAAATIPDRLDDPLESPVPLPQDVTSFDVQRNNGRGSATVDDAWQDGDFVDSLNDVGEGIELLDSEP